VTPIELLSSAIPSEEDTFLFRGIESSGGRKRKRRVSVVQGF
jgi:hypothetical protein